MSPLLDSGKRSTNIKDQAGIISLASDDGDTDPKTDTFLTYLSPSNFKFLTSDVITLLHDIKNSSLRYTVSGGEFHV